MNQGISWLADRRRRLPHAEQIDDLQVLDDGVILRRDAPGGSAALRDSQLTRRMRILRSGPARRGLELAGAARLALAGEWATARTVLREPRRMCSAHCGSEDPPPYAGRRATSRWFQLSHSWRPRRSHSQAVRCAAIDTASTSQGARRRWCRRP
jgi:hypothetical protein